MQKQTRRQRDYAALKLPSVSRGMYSSKGSQLGRIGDTHSFVGRFASQAGNILNDRGNAAAEITLMESAYCFERGKVSTRFSFRVML